MTIPDSDAPKSRPLEWTGPLGIKWNNLPTSKDALARVNHPALYLWFQDTAPGTYAGQVRKGFGLRMYSHFVNAAGGHGCVVNENGDYFLGGEPERLFRAIQDDRERDTLLRLCRTRLESMRFYYAAWDRTSLDSLVPAENVLISRLRAPDPGFLICVNGRWPLVRQLPTEMEFHQLPPDVPPDDRKVLERIFDPSALRELRKHQ